ncbi:MAG: LCP family protein [Acidimicrobiia bacterium]
MSSAGAFFRALFGRIGVALIVCIALTGAGYYVANRYIDHEIERIPRQALTLSSTPAAGTNFLIVGSDSREFVDNAGDEQSFGDTTDAGPPKSDTVMVLHADGDQSYAVSFPRDTWVTIPGRGQMKLNAAFNDGPQALVDTLHQNFDIPIDHYLEVDFRSFVGLVDAIGTVPVYFPNPTRDEKTGLDILFPGCNQLNGGQALSYVRSREPEEYVDGKWKDVSGLADLDRIARQQTFIQKLGRLVVQHALDDPRSAPDIADRVIPNLVADEGFDREAFNSLARSLIGLNSNESALTFATLPTERAFISGQDAQKVVDGEAAPMLEILRGNAAPTPTTTTTGATGTTTGALRPSDVRVNVLNGSGVAGAAGTALNDLGNAGFVRGTVGNSERSSVPRTEVRYRAGNEAKAQLVGSYVPGADLIADATLGSDVVVVVGKNFTKIGKVAPAPAAGDSPTTTTLSPEEACQ